MPHFSDSPDILKLKKKRNQIRSDDLPRAQVNGRRGNRLPGPSRHSEYHLNLAKQFFN